ncbi:MAG: aromatic ring-hydroxylating dioxygenase subunit alpha [Nocardioidaceae bacterium]
MTAQSPPLTSRDAVAEMAAARVPGRPLDTPFYTDDEVFETDVAVIFGRHWIFVGHDAEIPEPGDFRTVEVGSSSVILVRDDEEEVRAFHNVCRHRGARILDGTGSVGNIVCGYHQWTYGVDGTLLHAGPQPSTFDRSCFGLKSAHVRSVAGLLFLCLAADPPADFDDYASRIDPYLAPHGLRRTKVAAQIDLVEEGNWKLVIENNRECYHCESGHPELGCSLFPTYGYDQDTLPPRLRLAFDRYTAAEHELRDTCEQRALPFARIEELSGRATGFRIQREPLDGAGESFTPDGGAVCRRLLGGLDTPRLGRLSMHLQPNAWFHLLSDHAVTFSVLPLAADRTLVRTTWLVHEDAVEGEDYDLAELTHVWHQTNLQDGSFVARAQAGVGSPAYEPGPYAPSEYQVDLFCTWYVERLLAQVGP